jgi:hypothetical protein
MDLGLVDVPFLCKAKSRIKVFAKMMKAATALKNGQKMINWSLDLLVDGGLWIVDCGLWIVATEFFPRWNP